METHIWPVDDYYCWSIMCATALRRSDPKSCPAWWPRPHLLLQVTQLFLSGLPVVTWRTMSNVRGSCSRLGCNWSFISLSKIICKKSELSDTYFPSSATSQSSIFLGDPIKATSISCKLDCNFSESGTACNICFLKMFHYTLLFKYESQITLRTLKNVLASESYYFLNNRYRKNKISK